jgi:general secretion pathway protein N
VERRRVHSLLIKAVVVAAVILSALLVWAPAAWLGDLLQAHTPLRLVYAQGTIWRGSAMLAISDGRQARLVPGRWSWEVQCAARLCGRIAVLLQHPALQPALRIVTDGSRVEVDAGAARLPAALLAAAGAPFNTVRPGGTLHARWDGLRLEAEAFTGLIQIDWEDAQSALSPVAPLGDYRVTALGRGAGAEVQLTTLRGVLRLQGQGRLRERTLRFTGTAEAQPQMRASLLGLIGVLGRRVGDRAVLDWELRA